MNTIYDGSYTLGSTSALSFEAGPGIKIDEPSAGTVRIGTDETVLWSGNLNQPSAISLSEQSNNFTTIKMYLNDQNGWKEVKEYNADQSQFGITLVTPYTSNINSTIIRYGILSSTNYKDYTYTAVGRALLTTASNNFAVLNNSGPFIEKIIGIGRVSGT